MADGGGAAAAASGSEGGQPANKRPRKGSDVVPLNRRMCVKFLDTKSLADMVNHAMEGFESEKSGEEEEGGRFTEMACVRLSLDGKHREGNFCNLALVHEDRLGPTGTHPDYQTASIAVSCPTSAVQANGTLGPISTNEARVSSVFDTLLGDGGRPLRPVPPEIQEAIGGGGGRRVLLRGGKNSVRFHSVTAGDGAFTNRSPTTGIDVVLSLCVPAATRTGKIDDTKLAMDLLRSEWRPETAPEHFERTRENIERAATHVDIVEDAAAAIDDSAAAAAHSEANPGDKRRREGEDDDANREGEDPDVIVIDSSDEEGEDGGNREGNDAWPPHPGMPAKHWANLLPRKTIARVNLVSPIHKNSDRSPLEEFYKRERVGGRIACGHQPRLCERITHVWVRLGVRVSCSEPSDSDHQRQVLAMARLVEYLSNFGTLRQQWSPPTCVCPLAFVLSDDGQLRLYFDARPMRAWRDMLASGALVDVPRLLAADYNVFEALTPWRRDNRDFKVARGSVVGVPPDASDEEERIFVERFVRLGLASLKARYGTSFVASESLENYIDTARHFVMMLVSVCEGVFEARAVFPNLGSYSVFPSVPPCAIGMANTFGNGPALIPGAPNTRSVLSAGEAVTNGDAGTFEMRAVEWPCYGPRFCPRIYQEDVASVILEMIYKPPAIINTEHEIPGAAGLVYSGRALASYASGSSHIRLALDPRAGGQTLASIARCLHVGLETGAGKTAVVTILASALRSIGKWHKLVTDASRGNSTGGKTLLPSRRHNRFREATTRMCNAIEGPLCWWTQALIRTKGDVGYVPVPGAHFLRGAEKGVVEAVQSHPGELIPTNCILFIVPAHLCRQQFDDLLKNGAGRLNGAAADANGKGKNAAAAAAAPRAKDLNHMSLRVLMIDTIQTARTLTLGAVCSADVLIVPSNIVVKLFATPNTTNYTCRWLPPAATSGNEKRVSMLGRPFVEAAHLAIFALAVVDEIDLESNSFLQRRPFNAHCIVGLSANVTMSIIETDRKKDAAVGKDTTHPASLLLDPRSINRFLRSWMMAAHDSPNGGSRFSPDKVGGLISSAYGSIPVVGDDSAATTSLSLRACVRVVPQSSIERTLVGHASDMTLTNLSRVGFIKACLDVGGAAVGVREMSIGEMLKQATARATRAQLLAFKAVDEAKAGIVSILNELGKRCPDDKRVEFEAMAANFRKIHDLDLFDTRVANNVAPPLLVPPSEPTIDGAATMDGAAAHAPAAPAAAAAAAPAAAAAAAPDIGGATAARAILDFVCKWPVDEGDLVRLFAQTLEDRMRNLSDRKRAMCDFGQDVRKMAGLRSAVLAMANATDHECPVCSSRVSLGDVLMVSACKHAFCAECLNRWLDVNSSCPICRGKVSDRDMGGVVRIKSVSNNNAGASSQRNGGAAAGHNVSQKARQRCPAGFRPLEDISIEATEHWSADVAEMHGNKVAAILEHIAGHMSDARRNGETSPKYVVFAQTAALSDVLAAVFNKNNIEAVQIDSGKIGAADIRRQMARFTHPKKGAGANVVVMTSFGGIGSDFSTADHIVFSHVPYDENDRSRFSRVFASQAVARVLRGARREASCVWFVNQGTHEETVFRDEVVPWLRSRNPDAAAAAASPVSDSAVSPDSSDSAATAATTTFPPSLLLGAHCCAHVLKQ